MKKALFLLTCVMLGGLAQAAAVKVNADGTLSATGEGYVYTRVGSDWLYLPTSTTSGALQGPNGGYYPASTADGAIVGYDYDSSTGVFTASSQALSVNVFSDIGASEAYFSGSVTATGYGDFKSTLGTLHLAQNTALTFNGGDLGLKHAMTLDYGDMTNSSSYFAHTANSMWTDNVGALTFAGSYTLRDAELSRELFSVAGLQGTLNITNAFVVTDAEGNALANAGVIHDVADLQEGQSALLWADNKVTLVARLVPEPTTATLSLLALAGLAARRRR